MANSTTTPQPHVNGVHSIAQKNSNHNGQEQSHGQEKQQQEQQQPKWKIESDSIAAKSGAQRNYESSHPRARLENGQGRAPHSGIEAGHGSVEVSQTAPLTSAATIEYSNGAPPQTHLNGHTSPLDDHTPTNGVIHGRASEPNIAPDWSCAKESIVALAMQAPRITRELNPDLNHDHEIIWRLLKETQNTAKTFAELHRIAKSNSDDNSAAIDGIALVMRLSSHVPPGTQGRELEAARELVKQSGEVIEAEEVSLTPGLPLDEIGNGKRFATQHGHAVRYCKLWNSWLIFDGRRWTKDEKDGIEARAKVTARLIIKEAELTQNDDARAALLKHAAATSRRAKRETMVKDAASEPGIGITPSELDTDKWALNVLNGTLNLRTGELRPHNPADLLTKVAPVAYNRAARCPLWLQFLDKVFAGDAAMIDSIQRALGYALTGDTREQNFIIAQGGGSNGKSTLFQAVARILGDYALEIEPATIMVQKQERMAVDIADLFNVRFVVTAESNDTQRLDEAKMKKMTGGEQLTGERKFEHPFKFWPQFKLFLATNHLPEIRNTDNGIWRRVVAVPFDVAFWKEGEGSGAPELKADLELSDKLQAEYSGILAWLVEGCLKWQRDGLTWPQKVRAKKEAYRQDQDVLGQFLADCCIVGEAFQVAAKDLNAAYDHWRQENSLKEMSAIALSKRLKERGFVKEDSYKARGWRGLGLKAEP